MSLRINNLRSRCRALREAGTAPMGIVGILLVLTCLWALPALALDQNPLTPPDTSSPRATMRSFINSLYGGYRAYLDQGLHRHGAMEMDVYRRRALGCLDLSEVPPALVDDVGIESALLLKEVIDRIELPPRSEIPGTGEAHLPDKWVLPGTEITIAKVQEGPRAGAYLFTSETVRRADEFYERIKDLPYQPGASEGAYELYAFAPGWMIPYGWIRALPSQLLMGYHEQAGWQWLALGLSMLSGAALIVAVFVWQRRRAHSKSGARLLRLLFPLGGMAVVKTLDYFVDEQINITSDVLVYIKISLDVAFFAFVAGLIIALANVAARLIASSHRLRPKSIDAHLVRVSLRIAMMVLIGVLVLHAASSIGVPLTPVLAGLGVGGLAFALAAQGTLENVIAGLTLFADRPIRVGELCQFGDKIGTVEEIGLRSTRIRTFERSVVTVPNAEFSKMQLENFDKRDRMLLRTTLGLRYETTHEQLRFVLAKLREMLLAHPKVLEDLLWVRFVGFGAYSLDVEVFAYVRSNNRIEFLGIREDIYLRTMDLIDQAGTGFAFPSQTHYIAEDRGLNVDSVRAAEAEVESWRAEGHLPFPEFTDDHRRKVSDSLDFPPAGSPQGPPPARVIPMEADAYRTRAKRRSGDD